MRDRDRAVGYSQETEENTDNGSACGQERRLPDPKGSINGFIRTQVTGRGLDGRTKEAYRIDLEHFYQWLEGEEGQKAGQGPDPESSQTEKMEAYLDYLVKVKGLRPSTVARKYRVLSYYLTYLVRQGILGDCRPLRPRRAAGKTQQRGWDADRPGSERGADAAGLIDVPDADVLDDVVRKETADRIEYGGDRGSRMSKKDVDAFFRALEREYEGLDSDFRKRICLRDLVMMGLLFYHGIEVSELLRLEVWDYDRKTGVLTVQKKRGKERCIYLYSKALRERMERWIAEHGYFEHGAEYRGYLFLSKLGRPLSMKMVINIFDKYRVMAGIEKEITPKDLKGCMGEYARELMREQCG